jgi:hypothetical protein
MVRGGRSADRDSVSMSGFFPPGGVSDPGERKAAMALASGRGKLPISLVLCRMVGTVQRQLGRD